MSHKKKRTTPDLSENSPIHQQAIAAGNDHFRSWQYNVADHFKGKSVQDIKQALKDTTLPFAVAMENWISEGIVDYLGETSDVRKHIAQSDCVVLPSYREGTPRSLLEAAAMNKPIIASDVVGCREVVDDEENGFLCKPYDSLDLFHKMKKMIELNACEREIMGIKGRKKMEIFFDEKIVIQKYKNVISTIYS